MGVVSDKKRLKQLETCFCWNVSDADRVLVLTCQKHYNAGWKTRLDNGASAKWLWVWNFCVVVRTHNESKVVCLVLQLTVFVFARWKALIKVSLAKVLLSRNISSCMPRGGIFAQRQAKYLYVAYKICLVKFSHDHTAAKQFWRVRRVAQYALWFCAQSKLISRMECRFVGKAVCGEWQNQGTCWAINT